MNKIANLLGAGVIFISLPFYFILFLLCLLLCSISMVAFGFKLLIDPHEDTVYWMGESLKACLYPLKVWVKHIKLFINGKFF